MLRLRYRTPVHAFLPGRPCVKGVAVIVRLPRFVENYQRWYGLINSKPYLQYCDRKRVARLVEFYAQIEVSNSSTCTSLPHPPTAHPLLTLRLGTGFHAFVT